MRRTLFLILLALTTFLLPLAAAGEGDGLYNLVTGGDEKVFVDKPLDLSYLALTRGLRPWVLAWQTKLKVNTRLKPGSMLTIDTTHIVPAELSDGLVINLPELLLYQFHLGVYQRRYALAVGKKSWPTPSGNYYIRNKAENPTWTVPTSIQAEMEDMGQEVLEKVPPGPKNPLGKYWMGTSAPGVGIHATNRPWSVGHFVSHGCIRMLPREIAELFPQVEVGTPVKIIYQPVKMAVTPQGRIFLEAHPNIYGKKIDYFDYVEKLAKSHNLTSRLNWLKVTNVLKIKEGVARDVTKDPEPARAEAPRYGASGPRQLGLFPLQAHDARVE